MAERCPADLAAKLALYLDAHPAATLLLLDEGADPDEAVPSLLAEHVAFHVAPEGHCTAPHTPRQRSALPSVPPVLTC